MFIPSPAKWFQSVGFSKIPALSVAVQMWPATGPCGLVDKVWGRAEWENK